jgi:hypothetical protein
MTVRNLVNAQCEVHNGIKKIRCRKFKAFFAETKKKKKSKISRKMRIAVLRRK